MELREDQFSINGYRLPGLDWTQWLSNAVMVETRRMKFHSIIQHPTDASLFRLQDGTHILNWVLKNLQGPRLN